MDHATFQFYDGLNTFLRHRHRHTTITHTFDWQASIKDMIESLGVPHCEVELIVVNGRSVDFTYQVQPGDDIHVYPWPNGIDIPDKVQLRDPFPHRPRFILDTHLGRLASYLRMMGFDTLYRNDYPDDELAQVSHDEERILLSRDVGCLKRSLVIYGYFVRNMNPQKRIVEVMERFALADQVEPFKHCLKCNGTLHPVDKADIVERLPYNTAKYYDEFHLCESCGQVFWKGSHYERMQEFIAQVLE